jgi:hypothetical protein
MINDQPSDMPVNFLLIFAQQKIEALIAGGFPGKFF